MFSQEDPQLNIYAWTHLGHFDASLILLPYPNSSISSKINILKSYLQGGGGLSKKKALE